MALIVSGCSDGGGGTVNPNVCNPACAPTQCCYQGQCVAGTVQAACGRGGAICQACGVGTTCVNQQCQSTTTPTTCNASNCPSGCCSGTSCIQLASQSNALCGLSGQTCQNCGANQCTNGSCQSTTPACNASNCPSGCCLTNGQCLQVAQQNPNQCGTGGIACASCAGGTCQSGQCVGGTCNNTTCASGCCQGNTCLLFSQQNSSLCGNQGQACRSCGTGSCLTASGTCSGGTGSCANCSFGCCNGTQCIPYAQQGASYCGAGGQNCSQCLTPNACNTSTGICGGGTGTCNASNCLGCCQGNTCLVYAAQTNAACGTTGQVCTTCSGATPTCNTANGTCEGCNGLNCADGCCQNNACIKGTAQSAVACGKSGNLCQPCSGGTSCTDGACINAWRVLAISAKVTAKTPKNWDEDELALTGKEPDPKMKCRVQTTGKTGETSAKDDTYTPNWNQEILVDEQNALIGGLVCEVLDDDGVWGTDKMGDCPVFPAASYFNSSPFTVTINPGCSSHVQEVSLQFIRKQ